MSDYTKPCFTKVLDDLKKHAEEACETRSAELYVKLANCYNTLGLCYYHQNDYAKAQTCFDNSLKLCKHLLGNDWLLRYQKQISLYNPHNYDKCPRRNLPESGTGVLQAFYICNYNIILFIIVASSINYFQ